MSEATIRYAAAVVEKHELLKEVKHWKLSTKACINEMKQSLRVLLDSEATAKRDINYTRARLVEKLRLLEEKAERQLHDMVRSEEERIEGYMKALSVRQRRLDITEVRLKETSVGHKLKRWIEDGRTQVATIQDALINAKMYDIPTKLIFSLHDHLDPFLQGQSHFGVVSLESNSKVISKIVCGTEETLAQRTEGDGDETKPVPAIPKSDIIIKDLQTQTGKELKLADDRYFKRLLETNAPKLIARKQVNETAKSSKTISVTVTQLNSNTLRSRALQKQGRQRPKSVQAPKPMYVNQNLNSRMAVSAREDTRIAKTDVHVQTDPGGQSIDEDTLTTRRPNVIDMLTNTDSKERANERPKQNVHYLGVDFVKEITPFQKMDTDSRNELTEYGIDDGYYPQSPYSFSGGSLGSSRHTPCSSLASGPTHISPKVSKKAKSYFVYKAKFHTKKHPNNTDLCRLAGIVALTNGKIVVSDISHLQLMLFDSDLSYLNALDCPSPCGLCEVTPFIMAAALFHNRKVLLVKVHDMHMERYREIMMNCQEILHDVSFYADRFYVLCFRGDIHITETDGHHNKPIRTISTYMREGEAKHLETDPNSKIILVSGFERVICFDDEGRRQWQYLSDVPTKKLSPGGIVLFNERIFVADWTGHRVIELSMAGTFVRDVIADNIEYPHSISVNRQRALMYVTQSSMFKQEARSRSVKVFLVK